jgi:hypothetical protein
VKKLEPDFLAILTCLAEHDVDFIVVGGAGAALQDAPLATFDMEVVHCREPYNVNKLLAALDSLDAVFRDPAASKVKPARSFLSSPGHQFLMTRFGPLNLQGVIGSNLHYQNLLPSSMVMEISEGLKVRILDLSVIIKSMEESVWEKDRSMLPVLRRALEEKSKT